MNMIVSAYRIYPAWRGFDGDHNAVMEELAMGAAKRMGWFVNSIKITGSGFDRRGGHYLDFNVTYTRASVIQRSTT